MVDIKSKNIAVGKKLRCFRPMAVLLTPGKDYEILDIHEDNIIIMDDENDRKFPLVLSKDKDESPSIWRYFIVY